MQYNQPYGKPPEVTWGDQPYVNGNPSTGIQGSIPPAASIEYPQRELVNLMKDTTLITPNNSDLHQLSKSIMTGMMHYGVDSGTKNALQINMQPAPDQYYDGMFVFVVPAITNDAAATVNMNGLGAVNIVRRGGGPTAAGDLPAGYKSLLCYSKLHNNFELYGVSFGGPTGFLPVLTANTTWYVNGTTGSDTLYDGTSPTISGPHGPFKTIAKATQTVYQYGPSVYTATISIAAGTYPEAVVIPSVLGPTCIYQGTGKTSTFVTGANNQHTFNVGNPNRIIVYDICVSCGTGTGPPCAFSASGGGTIFTDNTATSGWIPYSVWEAYAGYIYPGNHTFNAGCYTANVWAAFFGGFIGIQQNKSLTFLGSFAMQWSGNPGFFVNCSGNGSLEVPVPGYPTFVNAGYVSGYKYGCFMNGTCITQGLGTGYFPGTLAGLLSQGGQYN
jgi:hypothetical protein